MVNKSFIFITVLALSLIFSSSSADSPGKGLCNFEDHVYVDFSEIRELKRVIRTYRNIIIGNRNFEEITRLDVFEDRVRNARSRSIECLEDGAYLDKRLYQSYKRFLIRARKAINSYEY